jgi:pimeloyl-ACP methyl ester carboxylesterase
VTDPFSLDYPVAVDGGDLRVARAGVPAPEACAVVLAIHGVASSHAVWRSIARELTRDGRTCLLAPDLRGRGRSVELPGPYGMEAHAADLLAVLDDAGAERAFVVGHSLGAYVATGFAARYPDRTSTVVLLDSGLAIPSYPETIADELVDAMVDSALEHSREPFASVAERVAQWRAHPAFADDWDEDIEAYARYDVAGTGDQLRAAVSETAVRADISELVRDERARVAIDRVRGHLVLVRARKGFDGAMPVLPQALIDAFVASHPHARLETVAAANHYTLVLGHGPGPRTVAAVVGAELTTAT